MYGSILAGYALHAKESNLERFFAVMPIEVPRQMLSCPESLRAATLFAKIQSVGLG
jgi:hypothetical protein